MNKKNKNHLPYKYLHKDSVFSKKTHHLHELNTTVQ